MMRPLRLAGITVGALAGSILAAAIVGACLIGGLFFVLWLKEEPPSEYARTHVQALFVDKSLKRTGTVESCHAVREGEVQGEEIWACKVQGQGCVRTFRFAVDHEYGTAPYDPASADATNDPCARTR